MTRTPSFHRRQIIQAGGSALALIGLPSALWSKQSWASEPFSMGVASGSPTSDSIVLWTRLDPQAIEHAGLSTQDIPVTWQLAQDPQFARITAQGVIQASPALAHSVHAEVDGLTPDSHYFYRFITGSATSATGRTRSLPLAQANVSRLRIAYASCQQWGNGFYSAYRHMLEENLDLVMFLGDYMYEYPSSRPKDIRPTTGGWVETLAGYRQRYALHKSDKDLQAIHAAVPWLLTWDDHEVQNDYAGTHPGNSGKPVPDFLARRRAAYQAYYEHMPVRRRDFASIVSDGGDNARVYSCRPYGQLASIYTLDTRQFKDLQACNPNNRPGSTRLDPSTCGIWNDPQRTMLGRAQENWLNQQFEQSTTQWNAICQSTLMGQRNFDTRGGISLSNDGWDGYPQARRRLTESMRQTKLRNPIVLGGDVHENWVGYLKSDYNQPSSTPIGVEFCGTAITSLAHNSQEKVQEMLRVNPHFVFANAQYRGYGVAEFTPHALTTSLRIVKDATDPQSAIKTLAKFVVETDQVVITQTV